MMRNREHSLRELGHSAISVGKKIGDNALSWVFTLLLLVLCAAKLWSWVGLAIAGNSKDSELRITESIDGNRRHDRIASTVDRVWGVSALASRKVKLFIAQSPDINAASFGNGRFLFWDGTADLPDNILEAIAAHEVAHDVLRHAQKTEELKDLTDFFGETVSVLTASDDPTKQTLKRWLGNAVLPKYSRAQELEADTKAIELLALSGKGNPTKTMLACLELLLSKYGNNGGRFLDSHPSTQERIEKLKAHYGERP